MKNKKAISLIVLVITILVLSILATSVIVSLSNANIIEEASDAVKKTEAQQIEEMKALMYTDGIMGYNPEPQKIGDITLSWNNEKKKVVEKFKGVVIPVGFYYVGGTKDTGLVISDNSADENKGVAYKCEGNQFVWVPVEYEIKEGEVPDETTGLYPSFTDVFKRGMPEETYEGSGIYKMTGDVSCVEPSTYAQGGYETEYDEYYEMCRSVQEYQGFYIARFEAGDATGERNASSGVGTVVSKKDVHVYNYVPWGSEMNDIGTEGAAYLSQNMYKDHAAVVSTLCYGVQWDTVMNFVSDEEHDINNSLSWGNYRHSTGAAQKYSYSLNTCGKNDAWQAKNIYDLAGNVWEWTMETRAVGVAYRGIRGGYFGHTASTEDLGAAHRIGFWKQDVHQAYYECGFRVTLYLK